MLASFPLKTHISNRLFAHLFFGVSASACYPGIWKGVDNGMMYVPQGIDGSARKPALRQDTGFMVEKTYHDIAPYLGAFGAYLMSQ